MFFLMPALLNIIFNFLLTSPVLLLDYHLIIILGPALDLKPHSPWSFETLKFEPLKTLVQFKICIFSTTLNLPC